MLKNIEVEICCGSYYDALQAWKGGAKRIELNSALYLGGLTPSLGTLLKVKRETKLQVICMVRPRGAGFCYDVEDFETMLEDASILLENGADGIAFGCLNKEGRIDIKQTEQMVRLIKEYKREVVFHRAFDCVDDVDEAMKCLITLGIDRVLTSGLESKAIDGAEMLHYLQETYGDRIEILAGSGVNAENVEDLIQRTGVIQVHSSCKGWCTDVTTSREKVSFSYRSCGEIKNTTGNNKVQEMTDEYEVVDANLVKILVDKVNTLNNKGNRLRD